MSAAQPQPSQPVGPAWPYALVPPCKAPWIAKALELHATGMFRDDIAVQVGYSVKRVDEALRRHHRVARVTPTQRQAPAPHRFGDHHALITAVLARASTYCYLDVDDLLARTRRPLIAGTRQEVMAALSFCGLAPFEIAAALLMDHSSILHGIQRVYEHPERLARAENWAFGLSARFGERSFPDALHMAIPDVSDAGYHAVLRYVEVCIQGKPLHGTSGATLEQGRYLTARSYRAQVESALTACGMAELCGLLAYHARVA